LRKPEKGSEQYEELGCRADAPQNFGHPHSTGDRSKSLRDLHTFSRAVDICTSCNLPSTGGDLLLLSRKVL
jgi:hypothetical protein